MLDLLLYTTLSCQQADSILFRIKAHENLNDAIKLELVETVKESAPDCHYYWDAHD